MSDSPQSGYRKPQWVDAAGTVSALAPGLLACLGVAVVAVTLGNRAPLIGAPVFALVLAIGLANLRRLPDSWRPGARYCSKKVLQYAIVVLGGSLGLRQVFVVGRHSAAVMLLSLSTALLAAWLFGRLLKVPDNLTRLVGVGTGICGGSAIAAIAPIIDADDGEIAFSISTVFLFNLIAVIVFPTVGHLLQLSDTGFGIWAGTAINDTSSVVAAGFAFSHAAGNYATITKLARTTMIVPVALAFAWGVARRAEAEGAKGHLARVMPWFVLGFLAAALLNSSGLLGPLFTQACGWGGRHLIVVALAGVGLGTDLRHLARTGVRPVLLGLLVWAAVALTSLGVQVVMGQW